MSVPEYHVIEKDNEVVFYIPYDEELLKLYTNEFFALHDQDADVAIIAFHNNDEIVRGGDGEIGALRRPYLLFQKKADYVKGELENRFGKMPVKDRSGALFSQLLGMWSEKEESKKKEESENSELKVGNMYQITIQKKGLGKLNVGKLKIPQEVELEKELMYYIEKLGGHRIPTLKYSSYGIRMLK